MGFVRLSFSFHPTTSSELPYDSILALQFISKRFQKEWSVLVQANSNMTALVLNYLIVHPEYQGRGLGKRLMNVGLEEAEKVGAGCFVVSTPAGEAVYRKAGFEEEDRFVVDPRPWGGKKEATWFCMRRQGRAVKK
jgi:predicted N-acetyltransferase YhbS